MPELPQTIALTHADTPLAAAIDAALQSAGHDGAGAWPEVGADAVVVLAGTVLESDRSVWATVEAAMAEVCAAPPAHVVVVTGSVVYGAAASNPVPLTEDALVRPDERDPASLLLGEIERRASRLRADNAGVTVTVLRPATVVGPEVTGWRSDLALSAGRSSRGAPPVQVVHERDVAGAVVHVLTRELGGVFNVAADGWLTPDEVEALVESQSARRTPLAALRRAPANAAEAQPYTEGALVLATTALRSTGWEPSRSNAQAVLATAEGRRRRASAQRKERRAQMRPVVVTGVAAAAAVALGSRRRHR